jgi:phosphoserine phosphatase
MAEKKSSSAIEIWTTTDAVCFDVDSTVVPYEGVDVLAAYCGVGEKVAEYTRKAMEGLDVACIGMSVAWS